MPLPVAHSLLGAALCVGLDRDGPDLSRLRLGAAVVLANAADLDYLPGLLVGDPHRFHRMAAHSFGAAVLVGLAAACLVSFGWLRAWPLRDSWPRGAPGTALMVGLLWATHIVLDGLNADYSEPIGLMMLWPISSAWIPPLALLPNIDKVAGPASPAEFLRGLGTLHNAVTLLWEALATGPLLAAAVWWRRRRV